MAWLYMGLTILIVPLMIDFVLRRLNIFIPRMLYGILIGIVSAIATYAFK